MRVFIQPVSTLVIRDEGRAVKHSEQLIVEGFSPELLRELYENTPDVLYLSSLVPRVVEMHWEESRVTTQSRRALVIWTEDCATYRRAFDIVVEHLRKENNGKDTE